jgi:hypothetical protein
MEFACAMIAGVRVGLTLQAAVDVDYTIQLNFYKKGHVFIHYECTTRTAKTNEESRGKSASGIDKKCCDQHIQS